MTAAGLPACSGDASADSKNTSVLPLAGTAERPYGALVFRSKHGRLLARSCSACCFRLRDICVPACSADAFANSMNTSALLLAGAERPYGALVFRLTSGTASPALMQRGLLLSE